MRADDIKAALMRGPKGKGPSMGEAQQADDPGIDIARDIIQAVKSGDAEALDAALRDHYEACGSESGDVPSGSDDQGT